MKKKKIRKEEKSCLIELMKSLVGLEQYNKEESRRYSSGGLRKKKEEGGV